MYQIPKMGKTKNNLDAKISQKFANSATPCFKNGRGWKAWVGSKQY
jgi:hypothetical protein